MLYQRLTIGADGKVLMCYNDEFDNHEIGNLNLGMTIKELWNGRVMNEARQIHKKEIKVLQNLKLAQNVFSQGNMKVIRK